MANETNQTTPSLIAVTGASGNLGRLVIETLLAQKVPADRIVAVARDAEKIADLTARGVVFRHADYEQPETLDRAFAGVEKLLLISGSEIGKRVPQHKNVVEAARKAGVALLAYTSILNADDSKMLLADEHKATEQIIRDSGIGFVLLRNGWYAENYTGQIAQILQHNAVLGSAGDGRVSAAARKDYAAAAAAVLIGDGRENKTYELGGDRGFTLAELAGEIARQTGREIVYSDLPADQYAEILIGAGLPEPLARGLADADLGIKRGDLHNDRRDLSRLINRPTTAIGESIAAALSQTKQ